MLRVVEIERKPVLLKAGEQQGTHSGWSHVIQALWTIVRALDCYVQWEANWEFPVNQICIFKRFE